MNVVVDKAEWGKIRTLYKHFLICSFFNIIFASVAENSQITLRLIFLRYFNKTKCFISSWMGMCRECLLKYYALINQK